MPNQFFTLFNNLEKSPALFDRVTIEQENSYRILRCIITTEIIEHSLSIANAKAGYTMNKSQSEIMRTESEKLFSLFRGILAETYTHIMLELLTIPNTTLQRWDLERDSFKYSSSEYDLRLLKGNQIYNIESRSSQSYKNSLEHAINNLDIIGPYTNKTKTSEDYNDFYIRPLYQYSDFSSRNKMEDNMEQFISSLYDGNITLYLVTGTDKISMTKAKKKKMDPESDTLYKYIPIKELPDIISFCSSLKKI